MIDVNSPSSPTCLTALSDKERDGNFMYRPIKWIRKTDDCQILKIVTTIAIAALLCCTVAGIFFIVIPGITEWNRQGEISDMKEEKEIFDRIITVVNPISASLTKFDNLAVKGQVNGLYITTNETNLAATHEFLKARPSRENTIHIGCATWHNFDIMCKRKSNYGLIVDFNPKNADFIKKTIEIIKACESREVFKSTIIEYLSSLKGKKRSLFFHKDQQGLPTDRIEKELFREGSWLQNEESYAYIKSIVSNDQIIAITENITSYKTFSKIREFLDSNHILIDTVYLSNICNFMQTNDEKKAFSKSITSIVDNSTIFISCPKIKQLNSSQTKILHQCSILGSEILEKGFDHSSLFELV